MKDSTSKDTPRHQRSRRRCREFHARIFDTLPRNERGLNFGMHRTVRVAQNSRMLTKHLPVRVTFSLATTSSGGRTAVSNVALHLPRVVSDEPGESTRI